MQNNKQQRVYLITGSSGFIGYYLAKRLLEEDNIVVGLDNLNDYYDVGLKEERNKKLKLYTNYNFELCDIADKKSVSSVFDKYNPNIVVNLAAQAGVRYSITHPDAYIQNNIVGFYNIVEACRHSINVEHLLFASSSSVYGANESVPFKETDFVDHPVSLYAATKNRTS